MPRPLPLHPPSPSSESSMASLVLDPEHLWTTLPSGFLSLLCVLPYALWLLCVCTGVLNSVSCFWGTHTAHPLPPRSAQLFSASSGLGESELTP